MFKLKAPCKDCPFRKDKPHQKGWLGSGRAKEIYENLAEQDGFFSCHKTVNYASENAGLDSNNKFCAGAIGARVSIWELQSAKKIKCQKINNRYRWRFCGIVKITYKDNKPVKVSVL